MDKFYTPIALAREIVATLKVQAPRYAADFAAGEGALLQAVRERWPGCRLIATDIDIHAIKDLQQRFPGIAAGVCDFLSERSRCASTILRKASGHVSLVFINPPFSCRGGSKHFVKFAGAELSCSRAMAFLLNAVSYVEQQGRVAALLPASCLTSQKDAEAMTELRRYFVVERVGRVPQRGFRGCTVEAAYIVLRHRVRAQTATKKSAEFPWRKPKAVIRHPLSVEIRRGRIPVSSSVENMTSGGLPFVHTTNLHFGRVYGVQRWVGTSQGPIGGPTVLLPRVGKIRAEKISLLKRADRIAISDCVFALVTTSENDASTLQSLLVQNLEFMRSCYIGSCAKYLTLDHLESPPTNGY